MVQIYCAKLGLQIKRLTRQSVHVRARVVVLAPSDVAERKIAALRRLSPEMEYRALTPERWEHRGFNANRLWVSSLLYPPPIVRGTLDGANVDGAVTYQDDGFMVVEIWDL